MLDHFELLLDPTAWIALLSLVVMEVLLGIDNLLFISLLTARLPVHLRRRAQQCGLLLALALRLAALAGISFVFRLTTPVVSLLGHGFSMRDLLLLAGGLFLVWKATREIQKRVDPDYLPSAPMAAAGASFAAVVTQIPLVDVVFSIDSIVTAVGLTSHVPIMMLAVSIAMLSMLMAADPLSRFLRSNPSAMMLALGYLLLIGATLIAEAFGVVFPKGYIYAAMTFSALIEILDALSRRARRLRNEAHTLGSGARPSDQAPG